VPVRPRRRARRTYHHGDLHRALVSAATDLLAAHGPDGVTLRGAARAAGVSQAAPYRHFDSKEALLAAVAAEGFQALGRALAAAPAAERGDPVHRLRTLAVCYIRFVIEFPAYYRLMWAPVPRGSAHPQLGAAASTAGEALFDAVRACERAGRIPAGRTGEFVFVGWSLLHGVAGLILDEQLPRSVRETIPPETLARTAIDVLLEGLLRRRPARRSAPAAR
jgi:AcrR family transcriptional regulator